MYQSNICAIYLCMVRSPNFSVDIFDWQIQADDFIADQQFHSGVIFEKCNQFTVCNASFQYQSQPFLRNYGKHQSSWTFYWHKWMIRHTNTLADLILDIPHERSEARFVRAIRVSQHAALKKVFLLWVLLEGHLELGCIVCLLFERIWTQSSNKHRVSHF